MRRSPEKERLAKLQAQLVEQAEILGSQRMEIYALRAQCRQLEELLGRSRPETRHWEQEQLELAFSKLLGQAAMIEALKAELLRLKEDQHRERVCEAQKRRAEAAKADAAEVQAELDYKIAELDKLEAEAVELNRALRRTWRARLRRLVLRIVPE